ncbi:MAG: 4-amino-4-deoxychorismate lyase [Akkermansiaceae bacterium]|nr:4-amino-4-deoxychorismate lyase [Akkermansiaceae bacterium]
MSWIWCDGSFRQGTLEVSAADRGLCHGLGAFETLLALDGGAVAVDLHFKRLADAVNRLGLVRVDREEAGDAIPELLERCGLAKGRARVRIAVTAGSGDLRELTAGPDGRVWIMAAACPAPPKSLTLATVPYPRNELSPLAGLKAASYAENLIALNFARKKGADEALFLNTCGDVCEAATANLFAIIGGAVVTPTLESGCLPGTARARVLQLADSLGFETSERDLLPGELMRASGVFLTSATRGVVEVAAIDGQVIATAPLTGVLRTGFERESAVRRQVD